MVIMLMGQQHKIKPCNAVFIGTHFLDVRKHLFFITVIFYIFTGIVISFPCIYQSKSAVAFKQNAIRTTRVQKMNTVITVFEGECFIRDFVFCFINIAKNQGHHVQNENQEHERNNDPCCHFFCHFYTVLKNCVSILPYLFYFATRSLTFFKILLVSYGIILYYDRDFDF